MAKDTRSEFAAFVREAGVRAVDRLGEGAKELATPLRAVVRAWSKLSDDQKYEFLDRLINIAQGEETEPAPKRKASKKSTARKPAKKK